MSDISEIKLTDLMGEQRELAELIGLETYIKLVRLVGGSNIYIAKEDKLLAIVRNRRIKEEYNGRNISYLKNRYRLSERRIRHILSDFEDINAEDDTGEEDNQFTLYDYLDR